MELDEDGEGDDREGWDEVEDMMWGIGMWKKNMKELGRRGIFRCHKRCKVEKTCLIRNEVDLRLASVGSSVFHAAVRQ